MGRKIFVSYKYGDTQVQDLNIYEKNIWGIRTKVQTIVRHYVDKLSEVLEKGDHIFKGEDDGQSLADFSDDYIASTLRDKIYDSSITLVLISKGMKRLYLNEENQWMPWEISYSLRESTRNGRTSNSNGIVAIVLPDEMADYSYYLTYDSLCSCRSYNTQFAFKIIRDNMFNQIYPNRTLCNGSYVYSGDYSYILNVRWDDFIGNSKYYLDKAIEIRDKKHLYNISKNLK